ncbi:hypothetical protein PCE1_004720 [Barthelona sp. PCE]
MRSVTLIFYLLLTSFIFSMGAENRAENCRMVCKEDYMCFADCLIPDEVENDFPDLVIPPSAANAASNGGGVIINYDTCRKLCGRSGVSSGQCVSVCKWPDALAKATLKANAICRSRGVGTGATCFNWLLRANDAANARPAAAMNGLFSSKKHSTKKTVTVEGSKQTTTVAETIDLPGMGDFIQNPSPGCKCSDGEYTDGAHFKFGSLVDKLPIQVGGRLCARCGIFQPEIDPKTGRFRGLPPTPLYFNAAFSVSGSGGKTYSKRPSEKGSLQIVAKNKVLQRVKDGDKVGFFGADGSFRRVEAGVIQSKADKPKSLDGWYSYLEASEHLANSAYIVRVKKAFGGGGSEIRDGDKVVLSDKPGRKCIPERKLVMYISGRPVYKTICEKELPQFTVKIL